MPKEVIETQHACDDPKSSKSIQNTVEMAAIQVVTASQESQDTQVSKRCTHSGILNMPHFEVDADILRGIELEDSLRRLGKLWRESPLDLKIEDRTGLWEKSRPVQKYDVFLSHTWLTPGRWKVFSLLLQSGWKQMFAVWFFCISVVMTIGLLGWLPKPFLWRAGTLGFVTPTPFGPWMLATSFFSMILGLSVVPYMPAWCRKSSVCFLDVACIHQTDKDLMARGVYGLGGFLRQSAELRVLWSGPYLTRLWCVFELAAYHAANPAGKVTLSPIFVETGVLVMFLGAHAASLLVQIIMLTEVFGDSSLVVYFVGLLPTYIIIHLLRKIIRGKHNMIESLETFVLSDAQCRNDFDREFIQNAICAWYGSEKAFEDFVRHDLREELLGMASTTSIPLPYIGMVAASVVSSTFDCITSLFIGKAPVETIVTHLIGYTFASSLFWFFALLTLVIYLCDRWAFPLCKDWDHLTTLVIFLVLVASFYGGSIITTLACARSIWSALAWCVCTALVAAVLILRKRLVESRRIARTLRKVDADLDGPDDRCP